MKIGIIGTEYAIRAVRREISSESIFAEIVEIPCVAENVSYVVETNQPKIDVIFFTGYMFFSHACQSVEATIPWSYAKRSEYSATRALLKASMKGADISRVTYDLAENPVGQLEKIISGDAGITNKDVRLFRYLDSKYYTRTEEDYIRNAMSFHRENFKQGKATLCLSGMYEVVRLLREEGYNAEWVRPTGEELKRQLNELILRYQVRNKQQEADMAFAVVALKAEVEENYNRGLQRYLKLNSMHQAETCVFNFAHMLGAAMEKNTDGYYMVYTTKAELSIVTNRFASLFLLQDIRPILSISRMNAGIGIGNTQGLAKDNAEQAIRRAERRSGSCYYILEDSGPLAGPFEAEENDEGELFREETIVRISNETGVGISIIKMLLRVQSQYKFDTVTSAELSAMCNMTQSNMNRILAKLEAENYAVTTGYRPGVGAGRPRRIIRLLLLEEMR